MRPRRHRWLLCGGGLALLLILIGGLWAVGDAGAVSPSSSRGTAGPLSGAAVEAAVLSVDRRGPQRMPQRTPVGSTQASTEDSSSEGSLRLKFFDRSRQPVAGVRVILTSDPDRLLRSGKGRARQVAHWMENGDGVWTGVSDAAGVIEWLGLRPGGDYQYAVISGHAVRCGPRGRRQGMSGRFAVRGAHALTSLVLSSSVVGRFPSVGGRPSSAVLFRVEGSAGTVLRSVAREVPDPETGRFCFGGVQEGSYLVRCQRLGAGWIEFATRSAEVGKGCWQVDLGDLVGGVASPTPDLVVQAHPVDQAGRGLEIPEGADWPTFRISVLAGPVSAGVVPTVPAGRAGAVSAGDRGAPLRWVQDRFALPLRTPVRLRGLPASGSVRLVCRGAMGGLPEGWRLLPSNVERDVVWAEDRTTLIQIPVTLQRLRPLRLRILRGDAVGAETARVSLLAPGFERTEEAALPRAEAETVLRLSAPSGRVQIYLRIERGEGWVAALGSSSGAARDVMLVPEPCPPHELVLEGAEVGQAVGYGPASLPLPVARGEVGVDGRLRCLGIPEREDLALYQLGGAKAPRRSGRRRILVRGGR